MPHFWCGVMKLSRISALPVRLDAGESRPSFQVNRRTVAREAFAERTHPRMILVELLATGQVRHGISSYARWCSRRCS